MVAAMLNVTSSTNRTQIKSVESRLLIGRHSVYVTNQSDVYIKTASKWIWPLVELPFQRPINLKLAKYVIERWHLSVVLCRILLPKHFLIAKYFYMKQYTALFHLTLTYFDFKSHALRPKRPDAWRRHFFRGCQTIKGGRPIILWINNFHLFNIFSAFSRLNTIQMCF